MTTVRGCGGNLLKSGTTSGDCIKSGGVCCSLGSNPRSASKILRENVYKIMSKF